MSKESEKLTLGRIKSLVQSEGQTLRISINRSSLWELALESECGIQVCSSSGFEEALRRLAETVSKRRKNDRAKPQ